MIYSGKYQVPNLSKSLYKNSIFHKKNLGSVFIKRQQKQDNFVSLIFLIIKISFSLLAIISLIKLSYSSKVRLTRLREIEDSFIYEKYRFNVLTNKFDDLFSSEGEQRFMKDQDCLLYTSPSPRDGLLSRMPSSA